MHNLLEDGDDEIAMPSGNKEGKSKHKISKHELSADDIDLVEVIKNPGDKEYDE